MKDLSQNKVRISEEYYYLDPDENIVDLERSNKFNPYLFVDINEGSFNRIKDFVEHKYDILSIDSPNHLKERKLSALESVTCNLIECVSNKSVLKVRMDHNYYSGLKASFPKYYSYRIMKTVVDALLAAGYIHKLNGYYDKENPQNSKTTTIWASKKLLHELEIYPKPLYFKCLYQNASMEGIDYYNNSVSFDFIEIPRSEGIILKTKKEKPAGQLRKVAAIVKHKATSFTTKLEDDLRKYNYLINNTSITIPYDQYIYEVTNPFVDIIYNDLGKARTYINRISCLKLDASDSSITHNNSNTSITGSSLNHYINNLNHYIYTLNDKPWITDIQVIKEKSAITQTFSYNYVYSKKLRGNLYRVFNNSSFDYGGRYYGAEYQRLNSHQRSTIKINEYPTVELDYKALHPSMLYNMNDLSYEGDPYDLYNGNEHLRKAVKLIFNIALNAENETKAYQAFNSTLYGFSRKIDSIEDYHQYVEKKLPIIKEMQKHNLKSNDLLKTILKSNPIFAQYMCTGYGLRLQNKDAQMASDILNHFTNQSIPCLCIHDSFIVKFNYEDELKEVMESTYRKHNNGFNTVITLGT